MRKILVITFIISAVVCAHISSAQTGDPTDVNKGPEIRLSEKNKRLLSAEMNAIQRGMNSLAISVPAGHWEDIAGTSQTMRAGLIMKKKLSKQQMNEFSDSLPTQYREMDRDFKKAAQGLADAAGNRDIDKVNSYFCKISETCSKCHNKFAKKRFPGFKRQ